MILINHLHKQIKDQPRLLSVFPLHGKATCSSLLRLTQPPNNTKLTTNISSSSHQHQ